MSAFVVETKLIDYLINAAILYNRNLSSITWGLDGERVESENATEVGAGLLAENIKSVNYRYNERTPLACGYQRRPTADINPVHVLAGINCYEYQACEHPEWAGSNAFFFCKHLKEAAIRHLPGYRTAPW